MFEAKYIKDYTEKIRGCYDEKKANRQLVTVITIACLGIPEWAGAYTTEDVYYNGQKFAELYVMNKGEGFLKGDDGEYDAPPAEYTLPSEIIRATKSSTAYWAGILNSRVEITQPWLVAILGIQSGSYGKRFVHCR